MTWATCVFSLGFISLILSFVSFLAMLGTLGWGPAVEAPIVAPPTPIAPVRAADARPYVPSVDMPPYAPSVVDDVPDTVPRTLTYK